MKKDKGFERMASIPEKKPAAFRPSIISEEGSTEVAGSKPKEIGHTASRFSGELSIRIPQSLYIKLNNEAKEEGVSLQEYVLYKLASKH